MVRASRRPTRDWKHAMSTKFATKRIGTPDLRVSLSSISNFPSLHQHTLFFAPDDTYAARCSGTGGAAEEDQPVPGRLPERGTAAGGVHSAANSALESEPRPALMHE